MEEKEFSIRRIENCVNGWNLYPTDKSEAPIYVSCSRYRGKMPPRFKFFWQKRKLKVKRYEAFVISAELDGVLLFELQEEEYPKKLQEKVAEVKSSLQKHDEDMRREDEEIKKALACYLQKISPVKGLEGELSKLRIPLRAYLKLHLFKGAKAEDTQNRLSLMFLLAQVAEQIYKRHVKETDKKYFSDSNCALAVIKFSLASFEPSYHFDMRDMEDAVGIEEAHKTFESYYEAKQLLEEQLPQCCGGLKRYLIYVIRQLLLLYAKDWDELQSHFRRDGWSNERLCSDEQDYCFCYNKMKLLHYTNFILPEKIPQDEIDMFIKDFSL